MITDAHKNPVRANYSLEYTRDVIIVGGGLAGTCAAITAARAGAKVVLVQDRPVLGGNSSSEVRLWILGATSHMGNNNRWAREGGVIDEILVENLYRNKEGNAVILTWQKYGIVPAETYKGVLKSDGRYDHSEMVSEMKGYLEYIKKNELWEEDLVVSSLKLIMDKYMGKPPETFIYNSKKITPKYFLNKVLKINLDDYVCVMSTISKPFFRYGEYEVKGNWWRSKDYYNLPLDKF